MSNFFKNKVKYHKYIKMFNFINLHNYLFYIKAKNNLNLKMKI